MSRAVDECIEHGILAEFLRENRSEVIPVSIFEYNEEEALKAIKADAVSYTHLKLPTKA